jgi:hypothetical protein
MQRLKTFRLSIILLCASIPAVSISPVIADPVGGVSSVESFIRSIITVTASLAGLIAAGFFVIGGLKYIVSSGHPEHLDRAKKTIMYSGIGLTITIAAFVLSNIVTTLATNAFGN